MRFRLFLQVGFGLLLVFTPSLTFARQRIIKLNPCEYILIEANATYNQRLDPNWGMAEALRVYKELQGKPIEVRNKIPIDYFRKQLPAVVQMLRQMTETPDRYYDFVEPIIGDVSDRHFKVHLVTHTTTVKKAIEKLIAEALFRYNSNTANLDWFPMFMLEVTALKHFVYKMKGIDLLDSNSLYLELGQVKARLLHQLHDDPACMHWPTPANLKIRHFENWYLGIKPLGYSLDLHARYDLDSVGDEDDYELYKHDIIAHELPKEFLPFRHEFALSNQVIDVRIALELDINQKTLLRLMKYFSTHEIGFLYRNFVLLKTSSFEEMEKNFKDDMPFIEDLWRPRLRNRKDFFFELTDQLQMMDDRQFDAEVKKAAKRFQDIVLEVFALDENRPSYRQFFE